MSKLTDVIANLNKKFKTDIITTDSNGATFSGKERVNFPDPAFDYLFYGGFFTHTLWEASGEMSGGKAQPMYSKVLTENGWKEFKDIRLFDKIYCEDGKLHEVIGIFPQGERDIYEVSFTDGKVFRCSDEHLFEYTTRKLITNGRSGGFIKTLNELIDDFKNNPSRQADYYFKTNEAVEFSEKQYKMPPYIVGLFLGDGHINSHCIQFINNEDDIHSDEEFEVMKTHTIEGKAIIEKAINTVKGGSYLKEARNMAAYHHERWDGKGYPEGLHGEVIPLSARIMAVADVFDALTSPRVYKQAYPLDMALNILQENAGTQFDPKCVEVFMEALPEVKLVLLKYNGN